VKTRAAHGARKIRIIEDRRGGRKRVSIWLKTVSFEQQRTGDGYKESVSMRKALTHPTIKRFAFFFSSKTFIVPRALDSEWNLWHP
jgi:hypothetical protein